MSKITTEIFIERSNTKHNFKYDYSKSKYIGAREYILIICKDHGEFLQTPSNHTHKTKPQGCPKCGNITSAKKQSSNTAEFIKKSKLIYGEKYDYSKVNYITNSKNVIIICKYHDDFLQKPSNHLNGSGCCKCGGTKKLTTDEFITNAKIIHDNKYDYSKTKYILSREKVIIICKNHGEFLQTPNIHLNGSGCDKCGKLACFKYNTSNTEEFIKKSKLIHKNKFDYSKVNYIKSNKNIIIICKEHTEFLQTPNHHLNGSGCYECGLLTISLKTRGNNEDFIQKAKNIHKNKYDYSKTEYILSNKKVIIICKEHGEFLQNPYKHIGMKQGCSKCSNKYSKSQIQWLEFLEKFNNIKIQHALNDGEFKIPNTRNKADGYCKENNTIYEFHGDYWHGNPKLYNSNDLNKTVNKTYGELYENTLKREQEIKDLGYNLEIILGIRLE